MTDSNNLKSALADELEKQLREGETVVDKEGSTHTVSAKPALLTVVLNFLKEYPPNSTDLSTGASSDALKSLAGNMPLPGQRRKSVN